VRYNRLGCAAAAAASLRLRLAIHSLRSFSPWASYLHKLTYARTSLAFTSPSFTSIIVVVLLAEWWNGDGSQEVGLGWSAASSSSYPRRMNAFFSAIIVGGVPAQPWQPGRGGTQLADDKSNGIQQFVPGAVQRMVPDQASARQAERTLFIVMPSSSIPPSTPIHKSTGKHGATQQRHPQPALPQGLAEPCQDMV